MLDWLLSGGDPYDGLRQMLVQALPSTAHWDRQATIIAVMVPLGILGLVLSRSGSGRRQAPGRRAEPAEAQFKGALCVGLGWPRALWWRFRPTIARRYLWQVGAYRISTKRRQAGVVGATGSRKSTLGAKLITGERPTLILTGEPSDPFRAATYRLLLRGKAVYWSALSNVGWNMLLGDPLECAERLTGGTKKTEQDTGLGRGLAQEAIAVRFIMADQAGETRTWDMVDEAMVWLIAQGQQTRDQNMIGAGQRWQQRFRRLRMGLGESLGHQLDLEREMERGRTVMMEMSSMRSPESTPFVAANILLDAKRAILRVPGGRLLIDEGWAFKERISEVVEVVRAGRRLGWEVYFFTQLPQDYPVEMLGNFRTWVFLMQVGTNVGALEWCSRAVHRRLPSEAFAEGVLKEGEGWLLTGGRLVRITIPTWKIRNLPDTLPNPYVGSGPADSNDAADQTGGEERDPGEKIGNSEVWEQVEPDRESRIGWFGTLVEGFKPMPLPAGRIVVPPWIAGNKRRLEHFQTLSGTDEEYGDHVWTRGTNKGYGKAAYANASGWQSHFLFWAWKVQWDRAQGQEPSDVEEFCHDHPDMVPFVWPEVHDELLVLRALKQWMAQPFGADPKSFEEDDPRRGVYLSIDHGCPGWPNTLCQNWRHLKVVTNGQNSRLRHSRRTGAGRLDAEGVR